MDSEDGEKIRRLKESQDSVERKMHEIVAIIEGRFGYPGLQQRVSSLDDEIKRMRETQEGLERDYTQRKEEEAKRAKYLTIVVGGVVTILAAVMATIIGVFVQTGLGG